MHSRFWIVVAAVPVLAACEHAAPSPSPVESPAPRVAPQVARAVPVDASVPADAPSDAAPPPDLDEVADAAPYVFREVSVGLIVTPTRQTLILRRVGDQASLRMIVESAERPAGVNTVWPEAWTVARTTTFVGQARRDGKRTRFHLTSAVGVVLDLACSGARQAIHRRDASFVTEPRVAGRYYAECTGRGVWRPAATQTVDVLACSASDRQGDIDHFGQFGGTAVVLALQPGVEAVYINSDCLLQGGGYRRLDPAH
jgi:hypothetical protein